MIAQAAGFAVLAALSPTALLVMAVTVLLVLRGLGLNQPREHSPRYGLRLGLGVIALATAIVLLRRGVPQPGGPEQQKQGLIGRITARPRPSLASAGGR